MANPLPFHSQRSYAMAPQLEIKEIRGQEIVENRHIMLPPPLLIKLDFIVFPKENRIFIMEGFMT